jgi:large subunit ribosomal protein L30
MANEKIIITLRRGYAGCTQPQRGTLRALGLRRREQSRVHEATPAILGMVQAVAHMVTVEPAPEVPSSAV